MSAEIQASVYLKAESLYANELGSPFIDHDSKKVAASIGNATDIRSIRVSKKGSGKVESEKIKTENRYELITDSHGRSMTERATSKSVFWRGNLPGDIYGAKSIKGTAMYQSLRIGEGGIADYGVQGKGLMDDACIDRCIRVSEVLRVHGLPTEKPVSVMLLNEVIRKKDSRFWEKIPISKWKKIKLDEIDENRGWRKTVDRYFSETNFASLERYVQVDERIKDLDQFTSSFENMVIFLNPIFKWLNVVTLYTKNSLISGTKQPEQYKTNRASMNRYFSIFLPTQIGTYLGRLHKLGIVHRYPHDQNWSMVGTLYDLDSPSGEAIYDSDGKPEYREYANDFYSVVVHSGNIIAKALSELSNNPAIYNLQTNIRAEIARNYIRERYGALNILTKQFFKNFYNKNGDPLDVIAMEGVWEKI